MRGVLTFCSILSWGCTYILRYHLVWWGWKYVEIPAGQYHWSQHRRDTWSAELSTCCLEVLPSKASDMLLAMLLGCWGCPNTHSGTKLTWHGENSAHLGNLDCVQLLVHKGQPNDTKTTSGLSHFWYSKGSSMKQRIHRDCSTSAAHRIHQDCSTSGAQRIHQDCSTSGTQKTAQWDK